MAPLRPYNSGDETKGLCCRKSKAVMIGLDGNVRSPRAAREKANPSISLFYLSFMYKSVLCMGFCCFLSVLSAVFSHFLSLIFY